MRALAADAPAAGTTTLVDACAGALATLATNTTDVPFALLYLVDAGDARRVAAAGFADDSPAAPERVALDAGSEVWPLGEAARTLCSQRVTCAGERIGVLPSGAWPEPVREAVVVPLLRGGLQGFLVVGISARRAFDRAYADFIDLAAGQITTTIVSARSYEDERRAALARQEIADERARLLAREQAALAEAERQRSALEITNQELDQYAYVASHDLKAPLRGIANLSQWIEEALTDVMDDETRQQMSLLRGRVRRLEALIDGILSYSRAGRVREQIEQVDMNVLLAECRDLLAPRAEATITFHEAMPTVLAERVPMQQVFLNLMSNALKHAGRPDVRIEIRCSDAGAFFDFTVSDDGVGIPARFHDRIWGIFQTLQARDKVESTGIGLSVVKKIVETRGGRVTLDSEPGAGATFHVLWPKRPKETL